MSTDRAVQRIMTNLVHSRDPVLVLSRYLLVGVLVVSGLRWLNAASISLEAEMVTKKDFLQDVAMAKAVAHGVNPYLPTSELVERFVGKLPHLVFAHPCPHPPPVALLLLPLAPFDYQTGAAIWFFVELLTIIAIVLLLSKHLKEDQKLWEKGLIVLAAFAWHPFGQELVLGQLGAPLLLFLVLAWRSLRVGSDVKGGILLGLSLSIKLFVWPVLLLYLARRRWRASFAALGTLAVVNLVSALVIGFGPVRYYFFDVSARVFDSYKSAEYNLSLWTVGWRIFQGTGSPVLKDMHAHPLVNAPDLARLVSLVVVVGILAAGLFLALRARHEDTSFAILTCISILISPVAWPHYLMQASLPAVIAIRQCLKQGKPGATIPGRNSMLLLLACVPLFVPYHGIRDRLLSGMPEPGPGHFVPFVLTLPIFLPVAALLLLIAVLWGLDRDAAAHAGAAHHGSVDNPEPLREPCSQ